MECYTYFSTTECLDFNVKVIRVYYCDIGTTSSTSDSVTTLSNGYFRFSSMEVALAFNLSIPEWYGWPSLKQ